MTPEQRILAKLLLIEEEMKNIELWQLGAPTEQAFESTEPFCIDTMSAHEWLQWVLIPRLSSMIKNEIPLPNSFAITPYYEEAFKDDESRDFTDLLNHLRELDAIFKS
ncbi:YqcC family protein [Proteus vulgaris]|uniref:YqcC family protein n=1 Tax=Proteus vulgaris TaxID=585 RepID=UPI0018E4796C|nr:YqcC family protein [Proteus vulgaris]MBI6529333.1 YqcC family protein [Proteus vulgaris]